MDNIGSEIGQKMRCAVKAKLIELGTGYIDDELPDYVMIMVANKRSKQQMVDDLKLFLGTNTQIFVNWLHEVLEKLQEVTLPNAQKKKKEIETSNKKDKKKEKKKKDTTETEKTPEPNTLPPLPSITEVIKEGFIQRAKQDLEIEAAVKTKTKTDDDTEEPLTKADEFDIPTITDIAKEVVEQRHVQELQQLEELQKKINMAKQQLRTMCSEESEDEDFESTENNKKPATNPEPVVTEKPIQPTRTGIHINPKFLERNEHIVPSKKTTDATNNNHTTSVHDRLGTKSDILDDESDTEDTEKQKRVIKLSAVRRAEREIYIPLYRRAEAEKQRAEASERQRQRENERDHRNTSTKRGSVYNRIEIDRRSGRPTRFDSRSSREPRRSSGRIDNLSRGRSRDRSGNRMRSRSPLKRTFGSRGRSKERRPFFPIKNEGTTDQHSDSLRKRIGSRVIVMPPKPPSEEGDVDVPVNSVIKIKPRVPVPESKQANKMLLLRAMAEAQKSTIANTHRKEIHSPSRKYLKRRKRGNERILVEILNDDGDEIDLSYEDIQMEVEDEYIPEPVTKTSESESDGYVYVPKKRSSNTDIMDDEDEYAPEKIDAKEDTQFVVTLEPCKKKDEVKEAAEEKPKRPVKERIGFRMMIDEDEEVKRKRKERFEKGYEKIEEPPSSNTPTPPPPPVIKRQHRRQQTQSRPNNTLKYRDDSPRSPRRSRSPNERKHSGDRKSDFWNDTKRDDPPKHRRDRARTISPINFELTDEETRSRSSHEFHSDDEDQKENNSGKIKSKLKKLEPTRKFDNVPSLLSSVALSEIPSKVKPKERCKYFPNCRDGSSCEFHHPSAPCNSFPNCKFGDKCLYLHPKCKFDQTCTRPECPFQHTVPVVISVKSTAPPLASSILPSQNYKPISVAPLPALCKFFPNCSNTMCHFYHPKPCRFGKNCNNKIECNFYHQDLPTKDKLKWVSSTV